MNNQSTQKADDLLPEKIKVLHIDDEEDFLYLTKEFIEKMSEGEIEVESLRDPSQVIEKIKSNSIDVIVCDYLMENLNGLDLLKTIKKEELNIPFIIFTGRGREEVVIDALNLGADYYIRKGSDARSQYTELVHQIRTVLRHKKAEEALVRRELELKEEKDLTQLYLNEATIMFVIVNANEEVELINKNLTSTLGYSKKDIIGKNWFDTVYSEDIRDEIRFSFQQVIVGMKKLSPYSEIEIMTKSGEKKIISWRNTPIKDSDDKTIKILGLGEDITKRKEIQRALQASEEKYRILVETSPYSIVLADLKGNVTYANQQAAVMHGVNSPEELIGSSLMEYTAPEDHQKVMERLRKQSFVSLKGTFEYTMLRKDGTSFPVELNSSVLKGEDGKPTGLMAIGRDLSERREAEKAIRESELKYKTFVQNFDGIAFQGSVGFKPFFFHGAVEEITGYTEEDFVDGELSWDQVVVPEDMKYLQEITKELENTPGFSNIMEYRIRDKTGKIKWIRQHVQNIDVGEDNEFIVQGSLYDITEEKLMEEVLKESENRFKSLFEGIPDAVFIVDLITKEIVDCNKQAEKLMERNKEEILSLKAQDLHPEESVESTMKAFERHAQGSNELVRTMVLTKNNRRVVVSINSSLITIRNRKYLQSSFRNITEIVKQEEELERSEIRYRRLIETSPDGIVMTDLNGNITFANLHAAKLYGLATAEELIGIHNSHFVSEEDLEKAINNTKKVLSEGILRNQEYKLKKKDGSVFFADINVTRLDDFVGNPVALLAIVRDKTERKKAELKLKESENLYRTIFENTGTANLIISEEKIIKMVNSKFEELTGYSKEEIEGKFSWTELLKEEDADKLAESQELHYKNSELVPDEFEVCFKDKSGNKKNALISVKTIPGTPDFIVAVQDITKMKMDGKRIKEAANLYKTLFEASGTMIAIANRETIVELMNDQLVKFSGYTKEEVEGKMSWASFVAETDLERLQELNKRRLEDPTSVPERYEANLKDKEGNIHTCLIHIGLIPDTDKHIISMIDISDTKKAEKELIKSENLYRAIFDATGSANVVISPGRIIKQVNARAIEISGYLEEELINKNWLGFIPESELEKLSRYSELRQKDPDSTPTHYETKFLRKDGSIIEILVNVTLIPHMDDYIISFIDITEIKRAEEEIEQSANIYKTIFEATGTANIIMGPDRIIKQVNSKVEEMTGYKTDELIGLNWSQFVPEEALEGLLKFSRSKAQQPKILPAYIETKFVNKDGQIREVIVNLTSIPNSEDYIVAFFDITDMKTAEEEIRKSEILYRTIFESKGMANVIYNMSGEIILVNSMMEKLSGYKKEELEGRIWSDFVPQPELDVMKEIMQKRIIDPSSVPEQYETRFIDKNGDINSILIAITHIPETRNYLATVADISDRKKVVDTLTKQKKELSDFAHLMAHDIRNCLSSIEGYVDLVQEDKTDSEQFLNKINKQTEYMRKLLDRSIELADAGQTVEKSDTVDLSEIVKSIAMMTIPTKIKFSTESLFSVKADKEKLSQIFKNIFENAVIHGQPRMIEVKMQEKDDVNVVKIINDGKLINKEVIKETFESAFTTKEKESIHGLSIVKRLIDAHNWKIILCEVTEKSCFDIIIPKEDIVDKQESS